MWKAAVECVSVLDVLLAMSHYSRHGDGGNMCRPHFVQPDSETQVDKLRDIFYTPSLQYLIPKTFLLSHTDRCFVA